MHTPRQATSSARTEGGKLFCRFTVHKTTPNSFSDTQSILSVTNIMPKNLAKVQKKIAKKKGKSVSSLHENSRDAKRLRRAGARSEKLDKLAAARGRASQPLRVFLFQSRSSV